MDVQNPPSPPYPPFPPFPPYPPYPPYAPTMGYPPTQGCCHCCAGHGGANAVAPGYPIGVAPPTSGGGTVVAPPAGGNTRPPSSGGTTVGDVIGGILNPVQGLIDLFT